MTRHFEFVEGTSSKFWEVSISDCDVTVRYGRIGSQGQGQTKSFGNPVAAQKHVNKLIASKMAKGYRECTAA